MSEFFVNQSTISYISRELIFRMVKIDKYGIFPARLISQIGDLFAKVALLHNLLINLLSLRIHSFIYSQSPQQISWLDVTSSSEQKTCYFLNLHIDFSHLHSKLNFSFGRISLSSWCWISGKMYTSLSFA